MKVMIRNLDLILLNPFFLVLFLDTIIPLYQINILYIYNTTYLD